MQVFLRRSRYQKCSPRRNGVRSLRPGYPLGLLWIPFPFLLMLVKRLSEATCSGATNDAVLSQIQDSDLLSSRDHLASSSLWGDLSAFSQLLVELFRVLLARCVAEQTLDPKFGHIGKNAHRRHALGAVHPCGACCAILPTRGGYALLQQRSGPVSGPPAPRGTAMAFPIVIVRRARVRTKTGSRSPCPH